MRLSRWILLSVALVFAIVASWLWWVKPRQVDMATYAPADSMLYLEANHPLEVVETIAGTDAWRVFEGTAGTPALAPRSRWVQAFIRWTGIGPIQSVILARAQIAAVVTDLGTVEEGDTLRIKQEEAILIETHTSEGRIKAPFEQAIKTLAEKNYGRPTLRRITLDGVEFTEWTAPEGSRQIVATIVGSLVIVGNSERAVQSCLAVILGRQPGLNRDPQLHRMRLQLGGENALAFGYVPPGNSSRLLAVGLPLLLGRAPGDSEFQRLITSGAAKVFGSLGWTSKAYQTGIEDRYFIGLQPSMVAHLKPAFGPAEIKSQLQRVLPSDVYSVTSYKFADPAAVWQGLKAAVSSQVDALSTIVFSSLLKSSLLSYGIDDPEAFLRAVNGELLTLRLDESDERAILIAGVRDRSTLRELVTKKMGLRVPSVHLDQAETFADSQGEFAASFVGEFIVIGTAADVRRYAASRQANAELSAEKLRRITFFASSLASPNIITYANDDNRVRSFISAVMVAKGAPSATSARIEEEVARLPYSVTETSLSDLGIERITRSPLGQFSALLPLLVPEQLSPSKTAVKSR
jgi:hypothetical protein